MDLRPHATFCGTCQPNELDQRRIKRLLEKRARYRYVAVQVVAIDHGYRIVSPNCSRSIDKNGGVIDIARLDYDEAQRVWKLYCKDHARNEWSFHFTTARLTSLMDFLNLDPARVFWQ